jgi:hypothetical protein
LLGVEGFGRVYKGVLAAPNLEITVKSGGGKDRHTVFIKKKKPSSDLENPRTPISPAKGFF